MSRSTVSLALLAATSGHAQGGNLPLRGTVTDASGAMIPHARVSLVQQRSQVVATAETDEAGHYTLQNLLPGVYTVRVEAPGFQGAEMKNVHVPTTGAADVLMRVASSAQQVTVTAAASATTPYSGGQVAVGSGLGLLGDLKSTSIPFSTTSYTNKRMLDLQAPTEAEVLNRDPSVRLTGQINGVTDSYYIRGFPLSETSISDIAFDGVYGVAPDFRQFPEYLENVEVLKGPGALLYGMSPNSTVGGVVNLRPKRPLAENLFRLTTDYTTSGQGGIAGDFSRRFGAAKASGLRLNGLHRQGNTSVDHQAARSEVGALSWDTVSGKLFVTADLIGQYQRIDGPSRPFLVGAGVQIPDAPNGRINVTQPWGWWNSLDRAGLLKVRYSATRNAELYGDVGADWTAVERLSDQTPTVLDARGSVTSTPQHARFFIRRSSGETGMHASGRTGPVHHSVALQGNLYADRLAQAFVVGRPIATNLYAPVTQAAQAIPGPNGIPKVSGSRFWGISGADILGFFDDRLQVTAGVREQQVRSENFSAATGSRTTSYSRGAVTPTVAVLGRPLRRLSLYGNYIQGLSRGDIAPDIAVNRGEIFAPYKTEQEEVGAKLDLQRALLTFAAFRITKPSAQLSAANVFGVNSEQRNQGVEFSAAGEPVRGLRVLGGASALDASLTKAPVTANIGKRPVGVPTWLVNVGLEWDLPRLRGLTLTGGTNATSPIFVNQANTEQVPSWVTADFGARYTREVHGRALVARAGVTNALNAGYWSGVASFSTFSLGAPRTVFTSASFKF